MEHREVRLYLFKTLICLQYTSYCIVLLWQTHFKINVSFYTYTHILYKFTIIAFILLSPLTSKRMLCPLDFIGLRPRFPLALPTFLNLSTTSACKFTDYIWNLWNNLCTWYARNCHKRPLVLSYRPAALIFPLPPFLPTTSTSAGYTTTSLIIFTLKKPKSAW